MPLFRKHHVRMLIAGHDHLFDHWVEWYSAGGATYRMDSLVTGGGGAPIYTYAGEPDLRAYIAAGARENVRVEHLMKPGSTQEENPHHFVVVQVDGDRLSLEVVGVGPGSVHAVSRRAIEDRSQRGIVVGQSPAVNGGPRSSPRSTLNASR